MQTTFYVDQKIVLDAKSPSGGYFDWGDFSITIAGLATVVVGGICIATGIGAPLGAMIIGGVACVIGSINTVEKIKGEYGLPMIMYTPYAIFSNSIPIFDINFFSNEDNSNNKIIISTGDVEKDMELESESSAKVLQPIVSGWYYSLRNFAIVAMLIILIYVGIRMMICSTSKEKAKYKQMIMDWLVGICLIVTMHYMMIFIVKISERLCTLFSNTTVENIYAPLPQGTTYEIDGYTYQIEEDPELGVPVWSTNFTGYARLLAEGTKNTDAWIAVEYTIIYIVMVIYTLIFTVIYLKRVLYMAFLTMIAPLVAMTYPLDKLHDGQAQGFNTWLKEYIFNALLAPVHMLLYSMLIGSVISLAEEYPVYALVALGFMIPAEKMLKNMFGFQKAESPAAMGAMGVAGAGMLMSGLNKLMHGGKKRNYEGRDGKQDNIRFKPENTNTLDTYVDQEDMNDRPQISSGEEQEDSPQRRMLDADYERYNTSDYDPHETAYLENDFSQNQPEYNGTEEERRQDLEEIYRMQGLTDEEIAEEMRNQGFDQNNININEPTSVDEIGTNIDLPLPANEIEDTNTDSSISTTEIEDGNNPNRYNMQTGPRRNNRIINGVKSVGDMLAHRFKSSHPLRRIGEGTGYVFGAALTGMLGLSAGIASGDLGKTAQYTATATHLGGTFGKGIANRVGSKGANTVEAFKQGYYGTEYEDKLREKQIKQWQSDPNNIQYIRARDEDYKRIMKEVYPEYAKYGCYNIKDFYAAYQLEKAGRSRAQAISAYKLAKRTGDITASPDSENKWRTRLETEFGNNEDVRSVTDSQYSSIEEEFTREQERIEEEYQAQLRAIESATINQEAEYRRLQQELDKELEKLKADYETQYKDIDTSNIDDEFEYKKIEDLYKNSRGDNRAKYEKKYKELYEKMQNNATDKKLKHEKLKETYEKNQHKLRNRYEEKYKNINASKEEKLEKLKEEKNERYKKLMEETQAKRARVKEIPLGFAETALNDVKMFYDNKD